MSPDFFRKYSNIITEAEAPIAPGAAPTAAPAAAPAAKAPAPAPRAAPGPNQVQVYFITYGRETGTEKPQPVEKLGMDMDSNGKPILFFKSPGYGDKQQADWDAKLGRWTSFVD
jgi:hypothetical protein